MKTRRILLLLVLFLLTLPPVFLQSVRADYTISINNDSTSVSITTSLYENLTANPLPYYNILLTGANASRASEIISSALNDSAPGVSISNLQLSSYSSTNTTTTKLNFNVQGITAMTGGVTRVNLSWMPFKVTTDITAGNVSLNMIGKYLAGSSVLGHQSSSVIGWNYFEDGKTLSSSESTQAAAAFIILDFSRLDKHLDSWSQSFSLEGGGVTRLSNSFGHNITAKEVTNEASGPVTDIFLAGYTHSVQLSVPGSTRIVGNSVVLDRSGISIEVMVTLIIALPLLVLASFLVERRILKPARTRSKQSDRGARKR